MPEEQTIVISGNAAKWIIGVLTVLLVSGLIGWMSTLFSISMGNRERIVAVEIEQRTMKQEVLRRLGRIEFKLDQQNGKVPMETE